MNRDLKFLCPKCREVIKAEVSIEHHRNEPIDFRGKDQMLIDHPEIVITIQCNRCDEKYIYSVNAGPLFFNWVGP